MFKKGQVFTKEHREKLRLAKLGRKLSPETKHKMSIAHMGNKNTLGYKFSLESRKKLSDLLRGQQRALGAKHSTEANIKKSIRQTGKKHTEESIAKMRAVKKGVGLGRKLPYETRKKMSKAGKEHWRNPDYVEKIHKGMKLHPNKPEAMILNILKEIAPNEWRFTGDFSFVIAGKNPYFANINGQKKLIELFGDYWHRGENPQNRINIFKEFGWDTLVIWEHELKEPETVKRKMQSFMGRDAELALINNELASPGTEEYAEYQALRVKAKDIAREVLPWPYISLFIPTGYQQTVMVAPTGQ